MNAKIKYIENWEELAAQANWSVKKMAKLCNVSIRSLEMYFLKTTGQTPKAWLTKQRHRHAIELLRGGFSVKETAAQLGYQYSHNFSREFKKRCDYYPTQIISTASKLRVLI